MRTPRLGILIAVGICGVAVGIAIALPAILRGDPASRTEAIEIGKEPESESPNGGEDPSRRKPADSRGERGAGRGDRGDAEGGASGTAPVGVPGGNADGVQPAIPTSPPPATSPDDGGSSGGGGGGGSGGGASPVAPVPPAPPPIPDDDDGEIDDDVGDDDGDSTDGGGDD